MPASEERMLIAHLVKNSLRKTNENTETILSYFERMGCMMTVKSEDDDLI